MFLYFQSRLKLKCKVCLSKASVKRETYQDTKMKQLLPLSLFHPDKIKKHFKKILSEPRISFVAQQRYYVVIHYIN